jgi:transposase, IS5 family
MSYSNKSEMTMSQMSFGDAEYGAKRKKTRREVFLAEMEQVVPWKSLLSLIEPFYPVAGRGRHPYPLETMLRVHLMQNWFGLSDPAMEEALYEITPMRVFAHLSLTGPIPDETTILNFRRLLETNELAPEILTRVNAYLTRKGLMLKRGSIVDATIIAAPSSTKNAEGKRDPEMHQTKKGNQWHFGMKAHIGVDADSGFVHTVTTTPANESDVEEVGFLLHGKEEVVHADAGYTGAQERVNRKGLRWEIAAKRGKIKAMKDGPAKRAIERMERRKASIRARVEHPFRVIKRQFGLMKVRFRGLAKNTAHVITLFALSNLWMARRQLLA